MRQTSLLSLMVLTVPVVFAACDAAPHRPSASTGQDVAWETNPSVDGTSAPDAGIADVVDDTPVNLPDGSGVDAATPEPDADALAPGPDTPTPEPDVPADSGPADAEVDAVEDTGPKADVVAPEPDVPTASDKVPVLMAQGYMGRTVMSCDDGQTWIHDTSMDADDPHSCPGGQQQCWGAPCVQFDVDAQSCQPQSEDFCDCDHHPGAGTGIGYGDGYFVATWGWGPKGSLRRSSDGVTWEMVHEGATGFAGITYGAGQFFAASSLPWVSTDAGATWQENAPIQFQTPSGVEVWNARRSAYLDVAGGRFVVTAQSGDNKDVRLSSDGGLTWWQPSVLPESCANWSTGVVGGAGSIVVASIMGPSCVSTDGGETFTEVTLGDGEFSPMVFDGSQFLVWSNYGVRYSSANGLTWTQTPTTGAGFFEAVAVNPETGTLVAIQDAYSGQAFLRSVDGGVTWTSAASFQQGHGVRQIIAGWADPTPGCGQ